MAIKIKMVANGWRRGVAFLDWPDNLNVTANEYGPPLKMGESMFFSRVFERWAAGGEVGELFKRHAEEYGRKYLRGCYFEHRKHRLYGIIYSPMGSIYELVLLIEYASRQVWKDEEQILERCQQMFRNLAVKRALDNHFKRRKKS